MPSASKLGSHIDMQSYPGQLEMIADSGCRLVFISENPGFCQEMRYRRPDMLIITRSIFKHKRTDDFLEWGVNSVEGARREAHEWLNSLKPFIREHPNDVYWHAVNEPGFTGKQLEYLAAFEEERQRIMHEEGGWKCALFNFPVGSPRVDTGDWKDEDWYRLYPALEAANRYKNILSLHEYWPCLPWIYYWKNQSEQLDANNVQHFPHEWGEGWLFARYRKIWRLHIEANNWASIRIALKEFGSSFVNDPHIQRYLGALPGAWGDCGDVWKRLLWDRSVLPPEKRNSEDTYLELLKWCDMQMQRDPYLLGCNIFVDGTIGTGWDDFDIKGRMSKKIYEYIAGQRLSDQAQRGENTVVSSFISTEAQSLEGEITMPKIKIDITGIFRPFIRLAQSRKAWVALATIGVGYAVVKVPYLTPFAELLIPAAAGLGVSLMGYIAWEDTKRIQITVPDLANVDEQAIADLGAEQAISLVEKLKKHLEKLAAAKKNLSTAA